jgi:hypothetical protein
VDVRQSLSIERRARENAVVSSVKVVVGVSRRDQRELGDHALWGFRWSRRKAHWRLRTVLANARGLPEATNRRAVLGAVLAAGAAVATRVSSSCRSERHAQPS